MKASKSWRKMKPVRQGNKKQNFGNREEASKEMYKQNICKDLKRIQQTYFNYIYIINL